MVASVLLFQSAAAGDFVADVVETTPRDTVTSKIYVRGTSYRIETEEEGKQLVILVDQEGNVSWICDVEARACEEIAADDIKSLMKDPFMSLRVTKETPGTEAKELDPQTIGAVDCAVHVIMWGDQPFYTYYASDKYSLPLKMIKGTGEDVVELKNIEERELDDAVFEVPEGFSVEKELQEKE
jgi:hypothetical protein